MPGTYVKNDRKATVSNMSSHLIAITGLIYAYVSAEQFWRGNPGMGIAYFGYAIANVGLYLLAR